MLGSSNATVRILTLPELNLAFGRTNIDSYAEITQEDSIGLYKLYYLLGVPGITNFTRYSGSYWYLASPEPHADHFIYVVKNNVSGGIYTYQNGYGGPEGIRPLIVLNPGVNVRFVDTNNNGVPEIQIVN